MSDEWFFHRPIQFCATSVTSHDENNNKETTLGNDNLNNDARYYGNTHYNITRNKENTKSKSGIE